MFRFRSVSGKPAVISSSPSGRLNQQDDDYAKHGNKLAISDRFSFFVNQNIVLIPRSKRSCYQLMVVFILIFSSVTFVNRFGKKRAVLRRRTIYFENPDGSKHEYPDSSSILLRPEVCFVSASYAKDVSRMDNLASVVNGSPYIRFFLFTNLGDDKWHTPGWEKITTNFHYRRTITHSRYGKFLGWKFKQIRDCRAVFYLDSSVKPNANIAPQKFWRKLAAQLEASEIGLMQNLNPKNRSGLFGEFLAIQNSKKDIPINIVNSLKWMTKQPDFDPDTPIYLNEHFGYNPNSRVFQNLSQAFWDHYSLEQDSWRDQPLWSFMLHRYNVTPLSWPLTGKNKLFVHSRDDYGHNGHEYKSEEDVLVDWS